MKLSSSYKEYESKKFYLTFGRIGAIIGVHVLLIGGGFVVSKYGSKMDERQTSYAGANGIGTWSNQSSDAGNTTVDGTANTLFDSRSGDLGGYNAGSPRMAQANVAQSSNSSSGRYAPRRPSDSGSSNSSTSGSSLSPVSGNDSVLQPIGSQSSFNSPSTVQSAGTAGDTIQYKVQNGDSIWGIHVRFNVSVADIVASNPGIDASSIRVGQSINIPRSSSSSSAGSNSSPVVAEKTTPVNSSLYTVKSGDSLSRIASRQGVTVAELRRANGLSADLIRIGQELIVPNAAPRANLVANQHTGRKYVVEPGDTLDKVAAVYDVTINELKTLNNIRDPRLIRIGQVLLIPGSVSRDEPAPAPTRSVQTQTPPSRPAQTLDSLENQNTSLPSLGTLDTLETLNEFDEDDLDEQPMIQIQE